mmetsp:Transcript_16994/g.20438  ORF Transcript_16994/g.20438 Transcript_16994/m.20438 type:complete len:85 (-) Transcript_16994:631-885(-)
MLTVVISTPVNSPERTLSIYLGVLGLQEETRELEETSLNINIHVQLILWRQRRQFQNSPELESTYLPTRYEYNKKLAVFLLFSY